MTITTAPQGGGLRRAMSSQDRVSSRRRQINSVGPGYTRTDMTGGRGCQTVETAAAVIVKYATCSDDGPNGGFFQASGPLPW